MSYLLFWPILLLELFGMALAGIGFLITWAGMLVGNFGERLTDFGFDLEDRYEIP